MRKGRSFKQVKGRKLFDESEDSFSTRCKLRRLHGKRTHMVADSLTENLRQLTQMVEDLRARRFTHLEISRFDSSWKPLVEGINALSDSLQSPTGGNFQALTEIVPDLSGQSALQENFQMALRAAHLGFWEIDVRTNTLTATEENIRIFQLKNSSEGKDYLKRVHPADLVRALNSDIIRACRGREKDRTTKYAEVEFRIVLPSGAIRHIAMVGAIYRDKDGNPVRVVGINSDVTEQRAYEQRLRESEERWKFALEGLGDGVWDVELQTKKCTFSAHFEKMLGYSTGELSKDSETLQLLVHPDDRSHAISELQACIEGKIPLYNIEHRVACKDGGWKWVLSRGVVVHRDPSGKPERMVGTFQDLTKRKEAEKERALLLSQEKKAREDAEKANRVKVEFLAILSHELRTPLTTILSWTQLLASKKLDAEKSKRGIEILEQSARAQGQLINDLLDISRIQAGKLQLILESVDPQKVLSASIDSVRNLAIHKSIKIRTQIDPSVTTLLADPYRLQQVMWNLITNAIKFSLQGGEILIQLRRIKNTPEDQLQIQVIDSGKGIKPSFLPHVFDRFSQADSTLTRTYGGLGLGLSIVQKLVEMHDGTVEVESQGENRGATFTVRLPIRQDPQITHQDTEAQNRLNPMILQGRSILVVEDEESIREVLSVILQSFGAKVVTSASVCQALSVINDWSPDLIVSDIAMPEEDGYSFIRKVRSQKSNLGKTPAIALTAYVGEEDTKRSQQAGFQSHLAKPVDTNKLVLEIVKILNSSP